MLLRPESTPGPNSPVSTLWPAPAVLRASWSPRRRGTDYLAVPGTRNPRLLVPIGVPGSDRSLARHGGSRRTRVIRSMLRLVLRSGAARWLPLPRLRVVPDPHGIEERLRGVLGQSVQFAVLLGPPRANLKPVLQVFAPDGTTVAFAKVATSPLTERLLATEASALQALRDVPTPGVVVPRLLDFSRGRVTPVLVQSALPHSQSGREATSVPAQAIASIATSLGVRQKRLGASEFWRRLSSTNAPGTWHSLDVSAFAGLAQVMDSFEICAFGVWHGDFAPWNAAQGAPDLEVWDWERFETDVPIGMDAAHWRIQSSFKGNVDPRSLWTQVQHDVAAVQQLAGCDTSSASLVSCCYLLKIWSRYRGDAAHSVSADLRARVEWLARLAGFAASTLHEDRPAVESQ